MAEGQQSQSHPTCRLHQGAIWLPLRGLGAVERSLSLTCAMMQQDLLARYRTVVHCGNVAIRSSACAALPTPLQAHGSFWEPAPAVAVRARPAPACCSFAKRLRGTERQIYTLIYMNPCDGSTPTGPNSEHGLRSPSACCVVLRRAALCCAVLRPAQNVKAVYWRAFLYATTCQICTAVDAFRLVLKRQSVTTGTDQPKVCQQA